MKFGETIAYSGKRCLTYTESLIKDIKADLFSKFASPASEPIISNHPSFILGHLSLYGPQIAKDLGREDLAPKFDDAYAEVYSPKSECLNDVDGTIYPPMPVVVENYFEGYRIAIEVLQNADDKLFEVPNPNAGAISRFPTLGSMHAFYISGHMMLHLGQLSAWRRAMGMAAA